VPSRYNASIHSTWRQTVRVIIKLYNISPFFAAFKESMTLNLAQGSSQVIDFGTNRKRVYIINSY